MNRLNAILMTLIILGTVAAVFMLGIMSLSGLPVNDQQEVPQSTLDTD